MSQKPDSPRKLRPDDPDCVASIKRTLVLTCLLAIGANLLFKMPVWVKALAFLAGVCAGVLGGIAAHLYRHRARNTPGAREVCLAFETAVLFFGGGVFLVCWLTPATKDSAGFLGTAAALLSGINALVWWYAFRFPRLHWHMRPVIDPARLRFEPFEPPGAPFQAEVPAGSTPRPEHDGRLTLEPPPGANWGVIQFSYSLTDRLHPPRPARPVVVKERLAVAGVPALLTSHRLAERGTLALRFVLVPHLIEIEIDETPAADPTELLRHIGRSVRPRPEDPEALADALLSIAEERTP